MSDLESARSERSNQLGTKPIGPLLVSMAVPATVAMGVNALYNVVDTIFIGRGVGALAIGGVAIAFPVQIAVLAVALMVGIGTASVVSRSLGAGSPERAARAVGSGIALILLFSVGMVLVGLSLLDPILSVLGATPALKPYAREYLTVIIPGSVFIAAAISSNHVVRSEGKATYAMRIMLIGAVLNIVLDPLFIFGLGMGVRGAAIATVISQFASFLYAVRFYLAGKSDLPISLRHIRIDLELSLEVLALGLGPFVRQLGQSLFIVITNNVLGSFGDELAISAFGVINRLLIFSLMPLIGIAQGFQPIAGYNYGARKMSRVKEVIRIANGAAVTISFVYFALVMLFPNAIFSVFTTNEQLIAIGSRAMRMMLIAIPLIGMQLIGAVFFQAVGMAGPSLLLSMARQVILLIPLVVLLPRVLGVDGVWWAFPIADTVSTVITLLWLRVELKKLHIVGCEEDPDEMTGC